MLFNSYLFIFAFLPVALIGYYWLGRRSHTLAVAYLAMASLSFYGYWRPANLLILVPSILINYVFAISMLATRSRARTKSLLVVAIAANLLALCYFKYMGLLVETAASALGVAPRFSKPELPLGISFFTFTQIAYLADVYCGRVREYRFIHYGLFVSYFPHLIAGPILHHKDVIPQLELSRIYNPDLRRMTVGICIFAAGLFKKCAIADRLSPFVAQVFDRPDIAHNLTAGDAWLGAIAYSLQLYFDFSGYCDMAVGLSLLFNINIPLNFNSPYKAENIVDFWKRWHMTLSRFLRDYLYIPLGGNRHGRVRRYINLFITMALGGLWHGASWTFLFWGTLHGVYLAINHAWNSLPKSPTLDVLKIPLDRGGAWLLTMLAVVVAWVPFRAASFEKSLIIIKGMAGSSSGHSSFAQPVVLCGALAILVAAVKFLPNTQEIFFNPLRRFHFEKIDRSRWIHWQSTGPWAVALGLILSVGLVMISSTGEFIYFQF